MTHQSQAGMEWLISEDCKKKALIIYRLKRYESQFDNLIKKMVDASIDSKALVLQCRMIVEAYTAYSSLWNEDKYLEVKTSLADVDWQELPLMLASERKKLLETCDSYAEQHAVHRLLTIYRHLLSRLTLEDHPISYENESRKKFEEFKLLAKAKSPEHWLLSLINFCNKYKVDIAETMVSFFKMYPREIKNWRCFYAEQSYINLFNTVFYYKLNPQSLYEGSRIPPDKLLSVYQRLDSIYQIIEMIQKQYSNLSIQYGLPPINDLLFHGDELPQGVVIQVDARSRGLIQTLIKHHQIKFITPLDNQAIGKLYDLCRAYKFWFNPGRLVDAVMVLQQMLMQQDITETFDESNFRNEMLGLYKQMKTTECLDLYGYFSNKDTGYLLRILNAILCNQCLSWLSSLSDIEKKAILRVFIALTNIMEALREELAQRNISSDPYPINYSKPVKQPGRRNSAAVKRVLDIYARQPVSENRSLENLFSLVENGSGD